MRAFHADPEIPESVTEKDLPFAARVELKTLTKENAEFVARHLAMAGMLIDTDPELAHEHALSASRKGGRIAMVRESLAITAYAIGDYALALRELRTYRRLSGRDDEVPLMVDCERGLGRPDRALELGRSIDREALEVPQRVQLAIAMSGARLDQGEKELALAELEIPQLDRSKAFSYSPALFAAYAAVLEELGRDEEAGVWNRAAEIAEDALEAAQHNEFETVEIVSEIDPDAPVLDDDIDEVAAERDDDVDSIGDAEREGDNDDTGAEPAELAEPVAADASAEPAEAELDDTAGVDEPGEPEDVAAADAPAASAAEAPSLDSWQAPADLQAQIAAEYDELIAEIEAAADAEAAAASRPTEETTSSAESAEAPEPSVEPTGDAITAETAAVTSAADAAAADDDDQPSLFDL